MTPVDRLFCALDNGLKSLSVGAPGSGRPYPARGLSGSDLTDEETHLSAALMRVNHAGEVAAQALYQGQAIVAEDQALYDFLIHSAKEEADHLHWCEARLAELNDRPSLLTPLWYGGALVLGMVAGGLGRAKSLGFLSETERQVEAHLSAHLDRLPSGDTASRAIVQQMKNDEATHGANARTRGGAELPEAVKALMKASAKVMTTVAHRI